MRTYLASYLLQYQLASYHGMHVEHGPVYLLAWSLDGLYRECVRTYVRTYSSTMDYVHRVRTYVHTYQWYVRVRTCTCQVPKRTIWYIHVLTATPWYSSYPMVVCYSLYR
jgi:hypothetical protein